MWQTTFCEYSDDSDVYFDDSDDIFDFNHDGFEPAIPTIWTIPTNEHVLSVQLFIEYR